MVKETPPTGARTISFEEQLDRLVQLDLTGDRDEFRGDLEAARPERALERSVLVPSRDVVSLAASAGAIVRRDLSITFGHMDPNQLESYAPIGAVTLPDRPAYSAFDIDLGAEYRGVTPEDALHDILAAGRTPLTLDEGVALMLQQPEVIAQNWGFSMAGSRRSDQRVPAFWISKKHPNLGWCWDRNPHTWLGTASCAGRV